MGGIYLFFTLCQWEFSDREDQGPFGSGRLEYLVKWMSCPEDNCCWLNGEYFKNEYYARSFAQFPLLCIRKSAKSIKVLPN